MSDFLFDVFPQIPEKQWKQKIQFDLKGKDYNQTLLTHTADGINIKPIYHKDTYQQIPSFSKNSTFNICQSIFISDEKKANYIANITLKKGANSILFIASKPFDIKLVLNKIPTDTELQFELQFLSENFIKDLINQLKNYTAFLNIDSIGQLGKTGNWFESHQKDFECFNHLSEIQSKVTLTCINTKHYQNAGATIVQQVAYALSHGFEYLNLIANHNSTIKSFPINASFAVGSNYFLEIAKIRAFRYLWNLITQDFKLKSNLHITVTPSKRNKTLYDYNTNMLRTTSESMSAILGGADTVCNLAYDTIYHKKNNFGERISRNQLLILKEESYFNEAHKFADGSYYIESLTTEISEKALVIFKDIEQNGGLLKQLHDGTIQRKIEESASSEQQLFDSGKLVLLGTNKHPNNDDRMKDEIELFPFTKINPIRTLIQPILAKRLAEKTEQERLKNET